MITDAELSCQRREVTEGQTTFPRPPKLPHRNYIKPLKYKNCVVRRDKTKGKSYEHTVLAGFVAQNKMREPFDAPVLGIDLGASFTKVSYRPGWTAGRTYDAPCRLLMIDDSALIPSRVIHTKDARKEWLCGLAAAHIDRSGRTGIF
jgi:hypothetical protein